MEAFTELLCAVCHQQVLGVGVLTWNMVEEPETYLPWVYAMAESSQLPETTMLHTSGGHVAFFLHPNCYIKVFDALVLDDKVEMAMGVALGHIGVLSEAMGIEMTGGRKEGQDDDGTG